VVQNGGSLHLFILEEISEVIYASITTYVIEGQKMRRAVSVS